MTALGIGLLWVSTIALVIMLTTKRLPWMWPIAPLHREDDPVRFQWWMTGFAIVAAVGALLVVT